jgi:Transglutaminase-like superfamily
MQTEMFDYYRTHSFITDPLEEAYQLNGLANDLPTLCRIVREAIIHFQAPEIQNLPNLAERLEEMFTRDVKSILKRVQMLSPAELSQPRPPEKRLVGNCRDHAVLLCAILRQQGVPARIRFGFARYINHPVFRFPDHVVCEYWNSEQERWLLVDPEQDETLIEYNNLKFNPHDVPRDEFIIAGQAWQWSRNGIVSPNEFGFVEEVQGMWIIQSYLVHDLAALNKVELLIHDCWGLADVGPDSVNSDEENSLLDQIAALTIANEDFAKVRALYQHSWLQVPAEINCYVGFNQAKKVRLT